MLRSQLAGVLRAAFVTLTLCSQLPGCSPEAAQQPPPPGGGKADEAADYGLTACERTALLAFVSACDTGDAALRERGMPGDARAELLADRGDRCSADPEQWAYLSLRALDRVPQIGTATIRNVGQTFAEDCAAPGPTAAAFFSPRSYAESHLPELARIIDGATSTIDIAVYSFSDSGVAEALQRAVGKGVSVRFIYFKARNAPSNPESLDLERRGVDVRYVASSKTMHHKFMIVDGPVREVGAADTATLVTGSGNWTSSAAKTYDENMIVLRNVPSLVLAFQHEFNTIWDHSEDFVSAADVPPYLPSPLRLDPARFPEHPAARAVFTMANFDSQRSGYPRIRGSYAVSDAIVAELQQARKSIHVASGHLRSKPIYEALVAAKQAHPQLEVRVYLDGQEYAADNEDNQAQLQRCLDKPSTDTPEEIDECHRDGWYYSYDVATVDADGDGAGGDLELRLKYYAFRWKHTYPQMHHKYIIIDGQTLITGSYNLSHNAEVGSFENAVILRDSEPAFASLIAAFEDNFQQMWDSDPAGQRHAALRAAINDAQAATVPLVFDPLALELQSVTELREAIVDVYRAANKEWMLWGCTATYKHECPRP